MLFMVLKLAPEIAIELLKARCFALASVNIGVREFRSRKSADWRTHGLV